MANGESESSVAEAIDRGYQSLEEEKYEEAKSAFAEALSGDGESVPAHAGICRALLALGDKKGAGEELDAAASLETGAEHLNLFNVLGIRFRQAREYDLSLRAFDRALAISPDESVLHYNKSLAQIVRMELNDALSLLKRAIELRPEFPEAKKACEKVERWRERLEKESKTEAEPEAEAKEEPKAAEAAAEPDAEPEEDSAPPEESAEGPEEELDGLGMSDFEIKGDEVSGG
ncbi:MAG: tetratricopeptide repeat protein [bacterium]